MAKKRPYSTQFTAKGKPRRYLLSGIPPTLWERARARARKEDLSIRTILLSLVEQWTDRPEGQALDPAPIEPQLFMDAQALAEAAREIARHLDRQARAG